MKRKRPRHERMARDEAAFEDRVAEGARVLEPLGCTRLPEGPAWVSPLGEMLFALGYAREPAWIIETPRSTVLCPTDNLALVVPGLVEAERNDYGCDGSEGAP